MRKRLLPAVSLLIVTAACDPAADRERPEASPQDQFFERLTLLCDKAYAGRLQTADPQDREMIDQAMVMHAARCEQGRIEIPFHVQDNDGGWNRSRTWIITRTEDGLRLKHRHRHEDGSLDEVTNYGGDSIGDGTAGRQEFPADEESITLFVEQGLMPSVENVWAIEISPPGEQAAAFSYELKRPGAEEPRHFRVSFDLAKPIEPPPPAWGEVAPEPASGD